MSGWGDGSDEGSRDKVLNHRFFGGLGVVEGGDWTEELVNWYFEPSQPLWIISGLKETFKKRYS